jgi:hypothetical protein
MRPTGVTIIGVLQIIGGILRILSALTLLGLAGLGLAGGAEEEYGALAIIIGIVMLIIGLAYFYLGWSMLGLRPWAWTFTLILNIIAVIAVIIELIADGFDWNVVVGVVIPLVIVYYLYTERVRQAFGK